MSDQEIARLIDEGCPHHHEPSEAALDALAEACEFAGIAKSAYGEQLALDHRDPIDVDKWIMQEAGKTLVDALSNARTVEEVRRAHEEHAAVVARLELTKRAVEDYFEGGGI